LVEHVPMGQVQIDRAQQNHVPVRGDLPLLDGDQSRGLHIPLAESIQQVQVAALQAAQGLPAGMLGKPLQTASPRKDLRKVQPIRRQLQVQPAQRLRRRQPARQVAFVGRVREESRPLLFIGLLERLHPGKLLRECVG
jgi:hypothetical protein